MSIWVQNIKQGWPVWAFIFGTGFVYSQMSRTHLIHNEVFGRDGNGGHMLKIVTDLTDQEIATLKFTKRLHWHLPTPYQHSDNRDLISNEEMQDRGIEVSKEKYIEYNKRPPHDKYL